MCWDTIADILLLRLSGKTSKTSEGLSLYNYKAAPTEGINSGYRHNGQAAAYGRQPGDHGSMRQEDGITARHKRLMPAGSGPQTRTRR